MVTNQHPPETRSKTNQPSGSSIKSDAAPASSFAASAPSRPHAMDGSQFHNVIEEQTWSELPPTPEEQMPRRARHLDDAEEQAPHPAQAQISVGPA